jgi:SNF2 family DNA or RNA helicase
MVNIQIKNNDLIVEGKSKDIFNWKQRAFFNISLGMKIEEDNNSYIFSGKDEFQDTIKEIIDFFSEENIEFTPDSATKNLILNIQNQKKEFDEVKENFNKQNSASIITSLKRELKPYQKIGLEHFLKVKHGANFSVPGSGKTTMVYAYFDKLKTEGIVEKILVVGPFSSFSPWEEESEECFGHKLRSARLAGAQRQSLYLFANDYDLFLCHYQTAANDISEIIELLKKHKFLLVIDESHNIKRFTDGVRSSAILSLAPFATRRVILSGTPMPNGLLDLWSQMTFLWPGKQLLGDRNAYKNRCDDNLEQEQIQKEIRPFFYRVKKTDLNLPEPKIFRLEYLLKPIQSQIYAALSIKLISELNLETQDRKKLKQWRKAKMVRLLQAASNPTLLSQYSDEFEVPALAADGTSLIEVIEKYSQFEIPVKFEVAINLAKKLLSEGKKVLLWTSFVHNIKMLEKELEKDSNIKYYSIHGAVPKDDNENDVFNREKIIHEFKTINKPALLIANPAACAESISLHKICHDAIYLDRTFNCGQFIQSQDRIHRIGLDSNEIVNYHILIAKGTIDETIDRRLEEKFELMKKMLEDDIPIGSLDIYEPALEKEDEIDDDFKATINDIQSFQKNRVSNV